ncbi:hypothetical protein SLNWT_4026 [Streptomyces albus]|uniref:Uncharacterized protein n=1 Tax=Streptomyces albus (strain ATCC 21838 / DSM 41398 / FERM P-419 / JCM 4703 / NBRC 107858) TaxID=1081613 RepID=A0A0B5F269_STRA4|nr:hypothetical protein SLNWT_4026 [Streptomyces albus]AOU78713.1 hypothetical protein SLNHY_4022 [Streptomyces albus]AYN34449.1 hypothetical protein DUI70_3950 [Streptomyces albus]
MSPDDEEDPQPTVAVLRARLRAAETEIRTPPGLWERVRGPEAAGGVLTAGSAPARGSGPAKDCVPPGRSVRPRGFVPHARASRRAGHHRAVLSLAAALAVLLIGAGGWLLLTPGVPDGQHPAGHAAPTLTVHNAETACRDHRTLECALRLARTPYGRYAAPDNAAGHVWGRDRLSARCVVTDGTLVRDESGMTSTRWYLATTREGTTGWLPGVRTRNTTEVRLCTTEEARVRPGRG